MYEPDTILVLKEQKPPVKVAKKEDPDTGRVRKAHEIPFPYNKVRVVGQSPVDHGAGRGGSWDGTGARGVIIEPLTAFGSTLDEPYGKLQKLYDVESIPSNEVIIEPLKVIRPTSGSAGPTPEEVFAKESPGVPPKAGQIRGRTSPLGDVAPDDDPNASPLGE
jgi:hypothetical protein